MYLYITGFRRCVNEMCLVTGFYAAQNPIKLISHKYSVEMKLRVLIPLALGQNGQSTEVKVSSDPSLLL